MIIVKLCGGLGNQMFQYALYRRLLNDNKEVYIDNDWNKSERGIKFSEIFQLQPRYASNEQKYSLCNDYRTFIKKVYHRIAGNKKTHFVEQNSGMFDEKILEMDNIYLDGYWQSEKYFLPIQDVIRKEFIFKEPLNEVNGKWLSTILNCNAVSIHIRRGDYLQFSSVYGDICTDAYYLSAMKYIEEQVKKPLFFIFSNDMDWCRTQFADKENVNYVDCNTEADGHLDMFLMSKCKHNIIANSSFSWWGAWLNINPNKIVIAPDKWMNTEPTPDIWSEGIRRL